MRLSRRFGQAAICFQPIFSRKRLRSSHYDEIFKDARFVAGLINSIVVAGCTVVIALVLGSLCAYALGRLPFRFKGFVLYLVLTMTMFPQISVLSGLFVMLKSLNLFNTRQGLIVTYLIFTLPFTIWVMTQYFRSLPRELEEAAYVDGASPLAVFWKILLPLTVPGLVSTGSIGFHCRLERISVRADLYRHRPNEDRAGSYLTV